MVTLNSRLITSGVKIRCLSVLTFILWLLYYIHCDGQMCCKSIRDLSVKVTGLQYALQISFAFLFISKWVKNLDQG